MLLDSMRITICGLPGAGTTTVAKELQKRTGLYLHTTGEMFRTIVASKGMTLEQVESDSSLRDAIDAEVDNATRQFGIDHSAFIIESRLAHLILPRGEASPKILRVLITCGKEERIRRIAVRENKSLAQAREETCSRERHFAARASIICKLGLNESFLSDEFFDLTLSSDPRVESLGDPQELAKQILDFARRH